MKRDASTQQVTRLYRRVCYTALIFCTLLIILLSSCSGESPQKPQNKEEGFLQNHGAGSYSLQLSTNKKELTIAEQLELVLEAYALENVEVEFPSYAAALGDFTLKDSHSSPAKMTGSGSELRVLHRMTYVLEPYLSGTYTIPAMTVKFNSSEDPESQIKLETNRIEVPVTSLLDSKTDQVAIRDIKPPHSLPPDRLRFYLLAGLVLILAAAAIAGFYFQARKKSSKMVPEVMPGPEEIARRELDRLLAAKLLEKGEIKLFHLRISDILRRYIENRFGLKAPERTTEEFLVELSQAGSTDNLLLNDHKELLTDFLTQCDLVKFAKHQPSLAECEKTVAICRKFIEKGSRIQGVKDSRVETIQNSKFKT